MKKSAFVAIMVVALVFGLVAYATAQDEAVTVTATINPAFSMTLDANSFAFGDVDLGTMPSIPGAEITVKSNRPWTYSEAAAACTEPLLLPLSSDTYDVTQGTLGNRGVTVIEHTYDLDLTGDAAYSIPADTEMTLTYGYTAVQN